MLTVSEPSALCPRDARPNGNPIRLPCTTSSPYNSTTQRTGRANSSFPAPQRMRTSNGTSATACRMTSGSTSCAGRAGLICSKTTHAPLSVSRRSSPARQRSICSSSTPQPRANPSSALVGSPCPSKAALSAGPRRVSSSGFVSERTPGISSASRRAVYNPSRSFGRKSSPIRPAVFKPCIAASRKPCHKESSESGGSSSVPSSNSTVRVSLTSAPAESPAPRAPRTAPARFSVPGNGYEECTSVARLPKWHGAHPKD